MSAPQSSRPSRGVLAAGLVLLGLSILLAMRGPALPSAGLDPSWELAVEFAAKKGLVFGRDYVFTFGPYHYLATRLFDPSTFPRVLFYDAFVVTAVFWTPLAKRSAPALAALGLCFALPHYLADGLIVAAMFAVFLVGLRGRGPWAALLLAFCAPLILAKYSFGLVVLPLVALADLNSLVARRAPVLSLTLGVAVLAADLAAGQPLSALPDLIVNTADVVLGYGRALQLDGPPQELWASLALIALALAFAAWLVWRDSRDRTREGQARRDISAPAAVAGFTWMLFVAFKMGFVRQDAHTMTFHEAAPLGVVLIFAFFVRPMRASRATMAVFGLVFATALAGDIYWPSYMTRPAPNGPADVPRYLAQCVEGLRPRIIAGASWLGGGRFAEMTRLRTEAEDSLRRNFASVGRASVDAMPTDVAELIASGRNYRPRPVSQSYSSYTPRLQALDRDFLAGPKAPEVLFLKVQSIDKHLPTNDLGPSLPVIGQRYDPVEIDPMGLMLRRRATPRAMSHAVAPAVTARVGRWIPAPGRPGELLMAHIKVERTLTGRLLGFLYREPQMIITLRTADGGEAPYRFVPDMAQLGVAISPLPANDSDVDVFFDPLSAGRAPAVVALRLTSVGRRAFGKVSVRYEQIAYAPGFAAMIPPPTAPSPDLQALLASLGLPKEPDGHEIVPEALFRGGISPRGERLCTGSFDVLDPPANPGAPLQTAGWAWDVGAKRVFDHILLVDTSGRVVGAAMGRQPRPDVSLAVAEITSPQSGWNGVALREAQRTIIAYGRLADGRYCEIGRRSWRP